MRLTLFFSRRVSLKTWDETGMFEREVALYKHMQQRGVSVDFITYHPRDHDYQDRIPGIGIHTNRQLPDQRFYPRLIPALHAATLARADVIKTNQMKGAEFAALAARVWNKPLIARCGYLWSDFARRESGPGSEQEAWALRVEKQAFHTARAIIVTTDDMREAITRRFPTLADKINVIPNYVDTTLFSPPRITIQPEYDVVFIGRLAEQKNIAGLLGALARLPDVRAAIIGRGDLGEALRAQYGDLGGRLTWRDSIPHAEIPFWLHRARVFVLPSLYEGHPKTLIEAQACGTPVIGGNSPGIREIIQHGITGWLTALDSDSIAAAIRQLLADDALRAQLSAAGQRYAVQHYALDSVVERELALYRSL